MKQQSVSKGFAILSAANVLIKILSFLYIPFLLGIIGEEGYGIYMAAYSVYVFIYVLANSGLPVAISKLVSELVAEGNAKDAVRCFRIARSYLLVAGILLCSILAALSGPISNLIKYPQARLAILALAPTLIFTSVASAYRGFFQGFGNMTPTAISQVIEQIVNTIFTLLFAFLLSKYGIEYACAGGTLGTSLGAFTSAIYLLFVKSHTKILVSHTDINKVRETYDSLAKKIANYSIPITLSVGLTYAGNLVDTWNIKSRLLVAGFSPENANILYGQLSRYVSLMNVPIAIITSLSAAIFPAIAGAVAMENHKLVQNRINYAFKVCLLVSIPSAVGLSILSNSIYSFLKFGNGYEIMKYGAIVLVFMSIVQIQNSILQSCGKLFQVVPNLFIGIIIKIISNYILIANPEINIYGAIIGSALGYIVPIVLNHILIKHSINNRIKIIKSLVSIIISSFVMAILAYFSNKYLLVFLGEYSAKYLFIALALAISIALGGLGYFYTLAFTGGLTHQDLNVIPARFRKYIKIRN